MFVFTYYFNGASLGGQVIVIAENREDADYIAKIEKARLGFPDEELRFEKSEKVKNHMVIYSYDGDY